MKLDIFEAATNDWDAIIDLRNRVNLFMLSHPDNVIKTTELVVGIFLIVFVYTKLPK